MELESQLFTLAQRCADQLLLTGDKIVFAESCTAGLLSATLSRTPGISASLCGSFVTYRESLKVDALGVCQQTLQEFSAVSMQTTREMLRGTLERCTESTLGVSITGHLGPDAPDDLDGLAFICSQRKNQSMPPSELRVQLASQTRHDRQLEAAIAALGQLELLLERP